MSNLCAQHDTAAELNHGDIITCQGLCSHLAHLWATSDSAPPCEAMGFPHAAGDM